MFKSTLFIQINIWTQLIVSLFKGSDYGLWSGCFLTEFDIDFSIQRKEQIYAGTEFNKSGMLVLPRFPTNRSVG